VQHCVAVGADRTQVIDRYVAIVGVPYFAAFAFFLATVRFAFAFATVVVLAFVAMALTVLTFAAVLEAEVGPMATAPRLPRLALPTPPTHPPSL
jgi:hypothetical protein